MNIDVPTPNIPLLRKAVEWAESEAARPAHECMWNQLEYYEPLECGTSFCVAGYVVSLQPGFAIDADGQPLLDGSDRIYWAQTAQELLGLTDDEQARLFYDWNRIGDVRAVAEEIAARVGERL